MGVLPLQFSPGEDAASLGLTGEETISIDGIVGDVALKELTVKASAKSFTVTARVDTLRQVLAHGGILQYISRQRAAATADQRDCQSPTPTSDLRLPERGGASPAAVSDRSR